MKQIFLMAALVGAFVAGMPRHGHAQADSATYLATLKTALQQKWPQNRTINLVFAGHSVPAGYANTPYVHRLQSYPFLLLKALQQKYPYSVVNVITSAIGGENSEQGEKRFKDDVLVYKPDVVFIDYALNDRGMGLERSRAAMEKMIQMALARRVKVILMTPSPDLTVDITRPDNILGQFTSMLTGLAEKYHIGLADSYGAFVALRESGKDLHGYMAQSNHPNEKGHNVIVGQIMHWF